MPVCDPGEVVVVPFPFIDQPITKRRPALVLSSADFNGANGHSVLAMITTAAHSRWASDITLKDISNCGLDHPSIIRWKVFTLSNSLIIRVLGRLGPEDRNAVDRALSGIFQPA